MEVGKGFSKKAQEDLELIHRAVNLKDQQAYAQLMSRYRKSVYNIVLKMVRNVDDAEDLTIVSFAKAFKSLQKFKPDYSFSTWLFRIATNNAIDFIRKKKLNTTSLSSAYIDDNGDEVGMELEDPNHDPQELAIKREKIEIIQLFVSKLPVKYQKLVRLRYFKEFSYEEIADELDAPLGTVKAQLHRARELLFELIKGSKDHI